VLVRKSLTNMELLALVAVARLGEEATAVPMREEIKSFAAREVSIAAIYAALDRLHALGLVRPWMSDPKPAPGGRARRHFALTAAGATFVQDERRRALEMWKGVRIATTGHGHGGTR
jgi:DNA-binding PadR family transcriptional regulator